MDRPQTSVSTERPPACLGLIHVSDSDSGDSDKGPRAGARGLGSPVDSASSKRSQSHDVQNEVFPTSRASLLTRGCSEPAVDSLNGRSRATSAGADELVETTAPIVFFWVEVRIESKTEYACKSKTEATNALGEEDPIEGSSPSKLYACTILRPRSRRSRTCNWVQEIQERTGEP